MRDSRITNIICFLSIIDLSFFALRRHGADRFDALAMTGYSAPILTPLH
jgi:hypothetical protein